MKYYRRLSRPNDPAASFSGMYLRLILLRKLQRWPEALAAAEEILAAFPRLDDPHQRDVNGCAITFARSWARRTRTSAASV